jgi:hypothetical protein
VRDLENYSRNIRQLLATLGPQKASAFSAACAERLMPLYRKYCQEQNWDATSDLEGALGCTWEVLLQIAPVDCLRPSLSQVEHLVPYPGDSVESALITVAQNAVICTDEALRYLLGNDAQLSVVPECALEAVASVDPDRPPGTWRIEPTPQKGMVKTPILPTVQQEIIHQRRDIALLIAATQLAEVIDEMRARARRNAHGQRRV